MEDIVLLHGFGGTRHAWDRVVSGAESYRPLALDLPGHGDAADVRPITFASCVEHVLARAPQRFALCGYSMGGRIALHVALAAPRRVARLVLISTTAGIEDADRAERRRRDAQWIAMLRERPYEEFVTRWRAQPLFAAEGLEAARRAREDQLRNGPDGLIASLQGVGAGEMEPLWDRLGELVMPVRVVAGRHDARYVELAQRLVAALPDADLALLDGGHALLAEAPEAVAAALSA